MANKIINLEEILKEKEFSKNKDYIIGRLLDLTNIIESKINEIYDIGKKYKNASGKCTDEQMKLFSKITCSYFRILFDEINNYNETKEENRVLYNFAKDLDSICSELPDLQKIIKEEDKRVLRLENGNKNNV